MNDQLDLSLPEEQQVVVAFPQLSEFRLKLRSGHEYAPAEAEVTRLEAAYPNVDVRVQLRRMALWLEINPSRRKTSRGVPRFIQNWLSRCASEAQAKPSAFSTEGKSYTAEGNTNW